MKKIALFLMSLISLITCVIGFAACSDDENSNKAFTYRTYDNGIYIVKANAAQVAGDEKIPFNIPDNYDNQPVYGIDENAFLDCDKLEVVIIPLSIKHIGTHAFYNLHLKRIVYDGTARQWETITNTSLHYTGSTIFRDKVELRCSDKTYKDGYLTDN